MKKILPLCIALGLMGCEEKSGTQPEKPGRRFAAVKRNTASAAAKFCETTYAKGQKPWTPPPERAVPRAPDPKPPAPLKDAWTWVNLWASWCGPCIKELPLLDRFGTTLRKEGYALNFELWSVDEQETELLGALTPGRQFPGEIRWLKSAEALPGLLAQLGVAEDSAIPIHALVDPAGRLRCVRVGAVGESAYGTIKALLSD